MSKTEKELEAIIRSYFRLENLTNSIDVDDVIDIVNEITSTFLVKRENDFDSTVVEKGYHYLVRFKSGNYGEVWYNYHGQWMYQFRGVEKDIDKIFTPRTK